MVDWVEESRYLDKERQLCLSTGVWSSQRNWALAQVDTRLGNVEQDIRDLRGEMNGRFDRVDQKFTTIYGLLVALLIGVVGLVVSVAGLWLKL